MFDVDIGQKICDKVVFLVQISILKTGCLQQKLIESDKVPHRRYDLVLFDKIVFFDHILCPFKVKRQLLLVLGRYILLIQ